MKKQIQKIIACIMVVLTLVCTVPVAVFATDYGSVKKPAAAVLMVTMSLILFMKTALLLLPEAEK